MSKRVEILSIFQAVEIIENLTWPLITTKTSVKCVESEGDCRYVRDPCLLLNQLDIEHPVGQYILSVCDGFIKQYKTGGEVLLFFICQWSRAASLLSDMGLSVSTISTLLREVITECEGHAQTLKIDIKTLRNGPKHYGKSEDMTKMCKASSRISSKLKPVGSRLTEMVDKCGPGNTVTSKPEAINRGLNEQNEKCEDDEFVEIAMKMNLEYDYRVTKECDASLQGDTTMSESTHWDEIGANSVAQNSAFHKLTTPNIKNGKSSNVPSTKHTPNITHWEPSNPPSTKHTVVNTRVDFNTLYAYSTITDEVKMKKTESETKMGELYDGEDDDDFSWFFTEDKPSKILEDSITNCHSGNTSIDIEPDIDPTNNTKHVYNEESAHNHARGVEDALSAANIPVYFSEAKSFDGDDACDLIRDIEDLKKNIETDLEKMKSRYRSHGTSRKRETNNKTQVSTNDVDKEFESSWALVESHVPTKRQEVLEYSQFELEEKDKDDFVTVQISFNKDINSHIQIKTKNVLTANERIYQVNPKSQIDYTNKLENEQNIPAEKESNNLKICDNLLKSIESKVKNGQKELPKNETNNLKKFDNLLKSMGKETKSPASSGTVLNNSRHFRTVQSVYAERKVAISDNGTHAQMSKAKTCNQSDSCVTEGMEESKPTRNTGEKVMFDRTLTLDEEGQENNVNTKVSKGQPNTTVSTVSDINRLLNNLTSYKELSADKSKEDKPTKKITKTNKQSANQIKEDKHTPNAERTVLRCPIVVRSRHFTVDSQQIDTTSGLQDANIDSTVGTRVRNDPSTSIGTSGIEDLKTRECKATPMSQIIEGILAEEEDSKLVKIVCDIVSQMESQGSLCIMDKLVDCHCICGPKADPRLVPGLIIKTSIDCVPSVMKLQGKHCRVLLVNADITPTFKHKGYKAPEVTRTYTLESFRDYKTSAEMWTSQVTSVLTKLSVDLILARGTVSKEMTSICDNLNIVAIETVPYRQLKLFSDITETDMATYITLATEDNICNSAQVSQLGWDRNVFNNDVGCEFAVTWNRNSPLTVVLSESTPVLADLKEQEFWDCLHRVTSCLQTGFLLPGNGQTETGCVEFLRRRKDRILKTYDHSHHVKKHCLPTIYEMVEQTFQKYVNTFHDAKLTDCVYDDYISKLAAWKTACDTVCTILSIEYYIITGVTNESDNRTPHLEL